ncbi:MAG: SDR family NAD(P)-dependent oxidoreductase [Pseudomonadota bacterium]
MTEQVKQDLKGHFYLITGATQGLGRAIGMALAQRGAHIVAFAKTQQKLEALSDAYAVAGLPLPILQAYDLCTLTHAQAQHFAESLSMVTPVLHGLYHCAANPVSLTPCAYYPSTQWAEVLHLHLTAPFFLTQALWPLLSKAPKSRVVIAHDKVTEGEIPFWGAYAAAKAGLVQVMQCWASESTHSSVHFEIHELEPFRTELRRRLYPGHALSHWPEVSDAVSKVLAD